MKKVFMLGIVSIMLFGLFEIGCKGNDGATGEKGPSLTGNLSGFVTLIDSNGVLLNDRSGVVVSLDGTSTTYNTNADGSYKLTNCSTGIYNITYFKSGYGTFKRITQQFTGGGTTTLGTVPLAQVPTTFTVSIDSVKVLSDATGNFIQLYGGRVSSSSISGRRVRLFVGTMAAVSASPGAYTYSSTFVLNNTTVFSATQSKIYSRDLDAGGQGILSGTTVYLIAYPASYSQSNYQDPTTGQVVYLTLNMATPSAVLSTAMPAQPF